MNELLPDPVYFAGLPTVITSGAVLLRDEHGRVVIEKPNYRDHWLLPGGGVDAGEDARECARREVQEELGLRLEIGRLLAVHWMPSRASVGAPMGAHFLFDAGVVPAERLQAEVVPQVAELDDWRLVEEDELDLLGAWGASRARRGLAVLRGEAEVDLVPAL
ncbi:ADP-ribose pyrophosphatase [Brachybacterium endophyticum]|uniref:ADP-ribose pyrophosphatase n=1 Tax=Brachybacterium endophyticum TaxID=2182385 RepID=A0A2U2RK11_9MICO|nr:NUDIX hydrolase [Brachybacterium endophyticum]PWH06208.1 ADP-ribose pyrophosphatase [Brachybacterium endophyticum]